jgi:hypothetical protein
MSMIIDLLGRRNTALLAVTALVSFAFNVWGAA